MNRSIRVGTNVAAVIGWLTIFAALVIGVFYVTFLFVLALTVGQMD